MEVKMKNADAFILAAHVDSTPTMIVNGKWRYTPQSVGTYDGMVELTNFLVAKESGAAPKSLRRRQAAGYRSRRARSWLEPRLPQRLRPLVRRTLTDGVLLIRPLEQADRDAMFAAVRESIAEMSPWLPWCHPAYMPEESATLSSRRAKRGRSESSFNFGIFDAPSGGPRLGISVNHIVRQNRMANVGYWVRTSATKRGIASRAVRLAAQFAFEDLGPDPHRDRRDSREHREPARGGEGGRDSSKPSHAIAS